MSLPIQWERENEFHDLGAARLIEHSLRRNEGALAANGALVVRTGKFTGRSPGDKFIVEEPGSQADIWWGPVNQPLPEASFERLHARITSYLATRETYTQDLFGGADPSYRLPLHVVTEYAWHSLFSRQLLIRPEMATVANDLLTADSAISDGVTPSNKLADRPLLEGFTLLCAPGCHAVPEEDGTHSETFIVIHFGRRMVLIGGTEYAGEIKKSVFTLMNYLLPGRGVLPMHCSANIGRRDGDTALFFGLSGTGKTTLSADPDRDLIGDDEHGWSDRGVFNFEGGCYAKCIRLSRAAEPEIWDAIRFGSVLENVAMDLQTREIDFASDIYTENTRAAYTIDAIPHARIPGVGGHPRHVVFLTADAFGVLPPISRLTLAQAHYHFLSGYTAKIAGTERGLGSEPQATFSACFGQPFLPLHPTRYAHLLGERLQQHGSIVWLVNTGWSGGPYGVGHRLDISYTRAMLTAALEGALETAEYRVDPVFGLHVPLQVPGVPSDVLDPRTTWRDAAEYDRKARELARRFDANFDRYRADAAPEVAAAGPRPD